ncbi:glycosyltransferase family 2 protein [Patescibacteria group bacterium]|nr:glycosyltransferase family 2 protein [Patescibacteria group bacterium]
MKDKITGVIVTRNRAKDLNECLQSLVNQTQLPDKVLIVNNNSEDDTSKVVKSFSDGLRIKEVIEEKIGYSHAYNRGLTESKTKWVVYIDDDCVAEKNWFEQVNKAVNKFKSKNKITAILGKSENYYDKNIYACAFQYGNDLWREENLDSKGNLLSYEILDSRNIVYNTKLLYDNDIHFDTKLVYGSEDSDLGLQIQAKGLKAVYNPKIIVCHKEPNTLKHFLLRKKTYKKSNELFRNLKKYKKVEKKEITAIKKLEIFKEATKKLNIAQKPGTATLIKFLG